MSRLRTFSSLAVLLFAYFYLFGREDEGRIVSTRSGFIQGTVSQSRDGRSFFEWLGIPYGMPPVGELRFASPEPVDSWEGVLDATSYGSSCAHISSIIPWVMGDENCLFVNVHVPKLSKEPGKNGPLLPVIIYIYGGCFISGSSEAHRPDYFMDEDVVLVTFNYRLGLLGFLSTGDEMIRGNMGLKDQALAIKWVNDHIRAFGGDPKRITLMGQSAGAASIHYQILSWQTKGMFQKAALLSGGAGPSWGFTPPEQLAAKTLEIARSLGCPASDSLEIVECLRGIPVKQLLESFARDVRDPFAFFPHLKRDVVGPTVEAVNDEEAFLTQHPFDALEKGKFQKVPLLAGLTADEGLVVSSAFFVNEDSMQQFEKSWEDSIARVCLNRTEEALEVAQRIKEYFFFNRKQQLSYEEKLPKYTELFSDCVINLHVLRAVEFQRKFSKSYLYYFNVQGLPSVAELTMKVGVTFNRYLDAIVYFTKSTIMHRLLGFVPNANGVNHADDLSLMFPQESFWLPDVGTSHPSYQMSKQWVKFLVDYAATEDDELKFDKVKLKPLSPAGPLEFLEVSSDPKIIGNPIQNRMDFYKSIGVR